MAADHRQRGDQQHHEDRGAADQEEVQRPGRDQQSALRQDHDHDRPRSGRIPHQGYSHPFPHSSPTHPLFLLDSSVVECFEMELVQVCALRSC